jgi:uncharacterized protein involved in type VI secretion and phage assembly
MDIFDQWDEAAERKRLYGVYPAKVTSVADEDGQGRVKVQLPWAPDKGGGGYNMWARPATLMGGKGRGTWFIPDVGDEVLVSFEAGDPRRPYVVGALWNGSDTPPEKMDGAGANYKKSIVSRRDIRITLDDTDGKETLTLRTPKQSIVINDGGSSIEIKDAKGNTIKMDSSGVTVTASAQVKVKAQSVEVSAGQVTVNAATSKFSGTVQAKAVITDSIIAQIYMTGIGNVL